MRQQQEAANLDRQLLQARYGNLSSDNALDRTLQTLEGLHRELEAIPPFASQGGRSELRELLQKNQVLLEVRDRKIARFEFENAILRNSLDDLPIPPAPRKL